MGLSSWGESFGPDLGRKILELEETVGAGKEVEVAKEAAKGALMERVVAVVGLAPTVWVLVVELMEFAAVEAESMVQYSPAY